MCDHLYVIYKFLCLFLLAQELYMLVYLLLLSITPNVYISRGDVLDDFGISFLCQFRSFVYFSKVPTSLWLLVDIQFFLRYLYTCRVQPPLYGNNPYA